jgi:hypothetical protein
MSEEREQRNQVFKAGEQPAPAQAVQAGIQALSQADKFKADFGIEIPVETVPLPSGGRVYPTASPLHGKEVVEIRAMTAREEDILTSRAYLKKGTVITELIKSCLVNKAIDPGDMLMGDRNALMVAIRITGYGPEYDAELECSNTDCASKANRTFNLGQLPIRRLGIEPVSPGLNLFEFKLPYCQKVVRFKFLTGHDEETILATQEKQKKLALTQSESTVTTNLLYSIQSVDGIEDRGKIAGFVRLMPARDSLALRNYIRDNEPGIIMRQEVSCPQCGHEEEVSMPIGVNFLWPNAGR